MRTSYLGFRALALAGGFVASIGLASAADNFTPTGSQSTTFRSKDVGSGTPLQVPFQVPSDPTGAALGVSGNPFFATITGVPTGASTAALQSSILTALGTLAAQDATLTSGNAKSINRGGAKGTTAAADVTSTASGANHQGLDVVQYDAAGNVVAPATASAQTAGNTSLATLATALGGGFPATQATAPVAGENHVGEVGGNSVVATATFTRPANTTAYAVGQLSANSVTAGSVTPISLTLARKNAGTGRITRVRFTSSNTGTLNNIYRVHLYRAAPTTTVGDGGTFAGATNIIGAVWVGSFDVTIAQVGSDGGKGIGVPGAGPYITFDTAAGTTTLYALVEVRSAYTPVSAEVFTLAVEADRD